MTEIEIVDAIERGRCGGRIGGEMNLLLRKEQEASMKNDIGLGLALGLRIFRIGDESKREYS